MTAIRPGRYRHYKGNFYEVIDIARHSETEEEMVVYRKLYDDRSLWVRPLGMFLDNVVLDGHTVPRFKRVEEERNLGPEVKLKN
ncbi:MAG: DUF1653 domain-containing protein [Desulfuromonadaceae bacterium]|nr:DUF1653 domain-containing protein [Desulfuromonadaceae bacterium]